MIRHPDIGLSCARTRVARACNISAFRILGLGAALLAAAAPPALAAWPSDLALTTAVSGASNVVAIRNAGDGTPRLFLVQQPGVILVYDQKANTILSTPFLNITGLVDDSGSEQGLLGLAFHPDYENNGFFYVNYTRQGTPLDRTVIARYQVSSNPNVATPGSALVMLEINQDFDNHNGGDIHFGPDGYLYIGMGDGGSGDDPNNRAQDPTQLLGKMLRIDVDNIPTAQELEEDRARTARGTIGRCGLVGNYGIPTNNPFAGDPGVCDETWAFGVRNPWRFSFDRLTGDMIIGDVGQNQVEEVSFQPASSTGGENYGWDCREGNIAHAGTCISGPLVEPILTYTHSLGCSITGGFRYRGSMHEFRGNYTYADFCTGRIWHATFSTGWTTTQWQDTNFNLATFGEDRNGEIYTASGSNIMTFTSVQRALFEDGFEAGDLTTWSGFEPQ
jgi:glucose/arabinose dehydrogenase